MAQSCAWFPVADTGTIGGPLGTGGGIRAVSAVGPPVLLAADPGFAMEPGPGEVDAAPVIPEVPPEPFVFPCPSALAAAASAARSLFMSSVEPLPGFCPFVESPDSLLLRSCNAA